MRGWIAASTVEIADLPEAANTRGRIGFCAVSRYGQTMRHERYSPARRAGRRYIITLLPIAPRSVTLHDPKPFMIALLIAASAFFSMAEISLAAARRLRLRQMATKETARRPGVAYSEQPGDYFTVVQVGQNAVAILGGIVGEGASAPFQQFFSVWMSDASANTAGFIASFLIIIIAVHSFADLFPNAWAWPNLNGWPLRLARPMAWFMVLLRPLVWFYSRGPMPVSAVGLSSLRDDRITSDDILAMMEAGARAGVLAPRAAGDHQCV